MLVVPLWLLLFVAPALFDAHPSTGPWTTAFLILSIPLLIAGLGSRLWRVMRT